MDNNLLELISGNIFIPSKNDKKELPNFPGAYIICFKKDAIIPDILKNVDYSLFEGYKVLYVGISSRSLRGRDYRQHFTGNNAGTSTLRKSLGVLFGYKQIPRDKDPDSKKTKFNESDEVQLSSWMQKNLFFFYLSLPDPDNFETFLIERFNPPLNISKNHNSINLSFRKKLSLLRSQKWHY